MQVLDAGCDVRAVTDYGDRQCVYEITRESRTFFDKASGERVSWLVSVVDAGE